MHIRFENYASSYVAGQVSLNHILGLAYAFAPYISHSQPTKHGFTNCNESFLTAVLDFQCKAQVARHPQQSSSSLENRLRKAEEALTIAKLELAIVRRELDTAEKTLAMTESLKTKEDQSQRSSTPLSESNINRTIKKK